MIHGDKVPEAHRPEFLSSLAALITARAKGIKTIIPFLL